MSLMSDSQLTPKAVHLMIQICIVFYPITSVAYKPLYKFDNVFIRNKGFDPDLNTL